MSLLAGTRGIKPASPTFRALDQGGWTIIPHPKAYTHNNKTYFGWVQGSDGAVRVGGWDHALQIPLRATTVFQPPIIDTHNGPAVLVRQSDSKIVTAYVNHNDSPVYVRISTNAEDVSSFGDPIVVSSGSTYTYAGLVEMRGVVNTPIYLFYTKAVNTLAHRRSTDGGATWSAETELVVNSTTGFIYWKITTDWDRRIDIFCTDDEPSTDSNLYHFYIDLTADGLGGAYRKSDGTEITLPPFTTAELTPVLTNALGPCWSHGAAWDGSAPATIIMQGTSPTDNAIKVARWRSGAWQVNTVTASVGGHFAGDKYFSSCGIDHDDPNTVYVAEKVGSFFEIVKYHSTDDGATWTPTTLTAGSSEDNVMPQVPVNPSGGLDVFWLAGSLTSSANYDFAVRARR